MLLKGIKLNCGRIGTWQAHTLSPSADIVKANTDSMSAMYFCKTVVRLYQQCPESIFKSPDNKGVSVKYTFSSESGIVS